MLLINLQLANIIWHVCVSNGNMARFIGQCNLDFTLKMIDFESVFSFIKVKHRWCSPDTVQNCAIRRNSDIKSLGWNHGECWFFLIPEECVRSPDLVLHWNVHIGHPFTAWHILFLFLKIIELSDYLWISILGLSNFVWGLYQYQSPYCRNQMVLVILQTYLSPPR